MNTLAKAIQDRVEAHVRNQVALLQGNSAEYRAVFNGPPLFLLSTVFEGLTAEGGIRATLASGESKIIPVVLQVDKLPVGSTNPVVGKSGVCVEGHLLDMRNSPNSKMFVGLIPPGSHSSLSQTSTRTDFGLNAKNNTSVAKTSDWMQDKFINELVDDALSRGGLVAKAADEARALVHAAIEAADQVTRADPARTHAWQVLSRLWSIPHGATFGTQLALACGFCPCEDGGIDADSQMQILKVLAGRLGDGMRPALEQIKKRAESDAESTALESLLVHLQVKCEVITALERSVPYYYGPFVGNEISAPPAWWTTLTLERWTELLESQTTRKEALQIECVNSITSQVVGITPVTRSDVKLRISLPDTITSPIDVVITREIGGAAHRVEWQRCLTDVIEIEDTGLPPHKSPIRYTVKPASLANAAFVKKADLRVISLAQWDPGVIICARTASKSSFLKKPRGSRDRAAFETAIELPAQGRHYLDLYVRDGVSIADLVASGSDESGVLVTEKRAAISIVSHNEYGFEVETNAECFYEFDVKRTNLAGEGPSVDTIRVVFTAAEADSQKCGSEFERLIALNRQSEGGKATNDVYIDRQLRSSDLQSWMLAESNIGQSFYPLVLCTDYSDHWRPRNWASRADTIYSAGKFLNDPRPAPDSLLPPAEFLEARAIIAEVIRGEDETGLVESARLGELMIGSDLHFAQSVEKYIRSYLDWLESSPDTACWVDISLVTRFESDGQTISDDPDAVLVSPLHPIRFAWHCLAQRSLFLAKSKAPCPAGSILDPDCVPDSLVLPLHTASGGKRERVFFSVECSSDYWSILWNGEKLGLLDRAAGEAPFDREFGILVGGISSGFSVSQVHRALTDVRELLIAKPVLNVLVASASGQNNACNEGLMSWCRAHYAQKESDPAELQAAGRRFVQILDDRKSSARPEDADISNLAEDTGNAIRWFDRVAGDITPDLAIIAQLETSGPQAEPSKIGSPLGFGGLIRHRVRQQLPANDGAYLSESRMGLATATSGDALADWTMSAIARIENLGETRFGYVFAPSVRTIAGVFEKKTQYAAVSSSAVDPACFLGGWLPDAFLWDYDLPSYSSRSGDSNGYYLLSRINEVDQDSLRNVLSHLPGCKTLDNDYVSKLMLEVSRRGIPTVRGLSSGNSGASGDLGLFLAARVLQDEFRTSTHTSSILSVWSESDLQTEMNLVIPVDPFKSYLSDLGKAAKTGTNQRPDLLVFSIRITDSSVACKVTPIEVKFRSGDSTMAATTALEALKQAGVLSKLLLRLSDRSDQPEMTIWKLAFQHLMLSMMNFGLRVYSQQESVLRRSARWSALHLRVTGAILSDEIALEIDPVGRLIVIDGAPNSLPQDYDGDGFAETIVLSRKDAGAIVLDNANEIYDSIKARIGKWNLLPQQLPPPVLNASLPMPTEVAAPTGSESQPQQLSNSPAKAAISTSPSIADSRNTPAAVSADAAAHSAPPPEVNSSSGDASLGINIQIGKTIDSFKPELRELVISDTKLNHLNIGVVGDLGTGKTQLLKSIVYQISQGTKFNRGIKPRVLIFDYKRDYSSDEFVKATGAKVVRPQHLPLNLFDLSASSDALTPWLGRFKFFSDVLDKIFSGLGHVQRDRLKQAVKKAYEDREGSTQPPTIYDIHSNYRANIGTGADSISSILGDIVDMGLFSPIASNTQSFDKFFDGVVVIALDQLGQDDRTKNMIVAILLNMFYESMLQIPKRPYLGTDPSLRVIDSYLLVDEADSIMKYEFDVLRKVLLQGREFGVGVILASQYLSHFKVGASDYREPLLTWFIHKVPNITPAELGALGITGDVAQQATRIRGLGLHECLYKTAHVGGEFVSGTPFYKLKS